MYIYFVQMETIREIKHVQFCIILIIKALYFRT